MNFNSPYSAQYYKLEVVSPVFIGGAKENDYIRGQDFFVDQSTYIFVRKRALQKALSPQEIVEYSQFLINNSVNEIEKLLKKKCQDNPELILFRAPYFGVPVNEIRAHISDANGKLFIPGSSLKGALRSIIGVDLMKKNGHTSFAKPEDILGNINNNFMRLIQVTDVTFENIKPIIIPSKIYSGDVVGAYNNGNFSGVGMWKHDRQGGHTSEFKSSGFVTQSEIIPSGAQGVLRINFGDELLKLINLKQTSSIKNSENLSDFTHNKWMQIAKTTMSNYINKEIIFFDKFPNSDFQKSVQIWEQLAKQNQEENSVLIRIGSGTGYHGITGDWQYADHTKTKQAESKIKGKFEKIDAITQKTRKVNFKSKDEMFFPGFVKLTSISNEEYLHFQQDQSDSRNKYFDKKLSAITEKTRLEKEIIDATNEKNRIFIEDQRQKELAEKQAIEDAEHKKQEEKRLFKEALTSDDVTFVKSYIEKNQFREGIDEVRRHLKEITPVGLPERLVNGNLNSEQFLKEATAWKNKNLQIFANFEEQLKERFLVIAKGQRIEKLKIKIDALFTNPQSLYDELTKP